MSQASSEHTPAFVLSTPRGLRVSVIPLGATITALSAPDRAGNVANVVLGLPTQQAYAANPAYFGSVVGRFANRIAGGSFALDGKTYRLACNDGANALHGGPTGFSRRVWAVGAHGASHLTLHYNSRDGEEGYPGNLDVTVAYDLPDPLTLSMTISAETDAPTVINVTNHSYFNLSGEGCGDILSHRLQVPASFITPISADLIPTGALQPVAGSPFDFRSPRAIGERIEEPDAQIQKAGGYDHTFVLDGGVTSEPKRAAVLTERESGRGLEILTTEPGLQVYSGNYFDGAMIGSSGKPYQRHAGVALETQHFPNSPNVPAFPSTTLRPGERFRSHTVWRFFLA